MEDGRQAIILVSQDEVLAAARHAFKQIEDAADEKQQFINKQVKNAREELAKAQETFWKTAELRLEELGLAKKEERFILTSDDVICRRTGDGKGGKPDFGALLAKVLSETLTT